MNVISKISGKLSHGYLRAGVMSTMAMMAIDTFAGSLDPLDVNADKSGGKTVGNVLNNVNETAKQGGTLVVSLAALAGYIIIIISLFSLYKASKDEREKPTSAIVGLFMGGLLAGVGTVMYIIRNSVVGDGKS